MKKIAFVIDSSSNILGDESKHIYLVPLGIIETKNSEQTVHNASYDMDLEKLDEKIKSGSKFKTSQSSIGVLQQTLEELTQKYDYVIGLPISEKLSSNYATWKSLESEFKGKFFAFNLGNVEIGIVWMLEEIRKFLESKNNEVDPKEVEAFIAKMKKNFGGVLVVSDVSQLIAGGRLKGFKAVFVKTLKLKLLISMMPTNGGLEYFDKTKTDLAAKNNLIDFLEEKIKLKSKKIKRAAIVTTILDDNENQKVLNEFKSLLKSDVEIKIVRFSPVIAVHTGISNYALLVQMED
ncbi:DegV family protein [Mycoplasma bradburyae]|uniref:DegV family protein n=1 Tax=Mycoplasma bradburyae TaxID=2963128 RepID=A0ABT5GCI8_9MOLU|nr:DegV family protein [Mycoplasma bradburyae]MDC4182106.1 DegV family protein [Mycoplasma bradburyae]MDC4182871.1 DegV family protein [Mycoplasma bradburyae]UTS70325.1 DegV family protein [Mycoplasma bradburyae]UTS71048.1 DegV family protein [Mycoplasma bradburyae]